MTTTCAPTAFVSALKADSSTAALVSKRIYKDQVYSKAKFPNIVIHEISNVHGRHSTGGTGKVTTRVQVDCRAVSGASVKSLSNAVREALHAKTAESIGTAPNDMFVADVTLEESRDGFIEPARSDKPGGQRGLHVKQLDFRVWHDESVP